MSHKVDDAATATAMQDHSEHNPSHAALDAHDGREPSGHGNRGRHGASTGKHAGHHVEMFRLFGRAAASGLAAPSAAKLLPRTQEALSPSRRQGL